MLSDSRAIRRHALKIGLLLLFSLLLIGIVVATRPTHFSPLPLPELRTYSNLLKWSVENGMPGAILLVKTPTGEFLESSGYADLGRKTPMRTDHGFRIGSITKSFLGIVAAQMHVEGKLHLDERIANRVSKATLEHIAWAFTARGVVQMPHRFMAIVAELPVTFRLPTINRNATSPSFSLDRPHFSKREVSIAHWANSLRLFATRSLISRSAISNQQSAIRVRCLR